MLLPQFSFNALVNINSFQYSLVRRFRFLLSGDFPAGSDAFFRDDPPRGGKMIQVRRKHIIHRVKGVDNFAGIESSITDPFADDVTVPFFHETIVILAIGPRTAKLHAPLFAPVIAMPINEFTAGIRMPFHCFERNIILDIFHISHGCNFPLVPLRPSGTPQSRHIRAVHRVNKISDQSMAAMRHRVNLFGAKLGFVPISVANRYQRVNRTRRSRTFAIGDKSLSFESGHPVF